MNVDLQGKVAVVTGGARGIGRAIVLNLAKNGADIVIGDLDLSPADALENNSAQKTVMEEVQSMGQRCAAVAGDLSTRAQADALIAKAIKVFGRVDILVNNAGGMISSAETSRGSNMSEADLDLIFAVNLKSTIFCCQAAVEFMRKHGGGSIVNIASGVGLDASAREGRLAHYGMSKTSVIQYSRFLAVELGPENVRVNAVSPGMVGTARILKSAQERKISTDEDLLRVPLRRRGTPADIANAVIFFASDASAYVTGQCLSVCGGRIVTPS